MYYYLCSVSNMSNSRILLALSFRSKFSNELLVYYYIYCSTIEQNNNTFVLTHTYDSVTTLVKFPFRTDRWG